MSAIVKDDFYEELSKQWQSSHREWLLTNVGVLMKDWADRYEPGRKVDVSFLIHELAHALHRDEHWRDIESAPKNGEWVQVIVCGFEDKPVVARWHEGRWEADLEFADGPDCQAHSTLHTYDVYEWKPLGCR